MFSIFFYFSIFLDCWFLLAQAIREQFEDIILLFIDLGCVGVVKTKWIANGTSEARGVSAIATPLKARIVSSQMFVLMDMYLKTSFQLALHNAPAEASNPRCHTNEASRNQAPIPMSHSS